MRAASILSTRQPPKSHSPNLMQITGRLYAMRWNCRAVRGSLSPINRRLRTYRILINRYVLASDRRVENWFWDARMLSSLTTLMSLEVENACFHLIPIQCPHRQKYKIYFSIMLNQREPMQKQKTKSLSFRRTNKKKMFFFCLKFLQCLLFTIRFGRSSSHLASLNSSNVLMYVFVYLNWRATMFRCHFIGFQRKQQHAHQTINHHSERYYDSCNLFDWKPFLFFGFRWIKSIASISISIETTQPYVLHSHMRLRIIHPNAFHSHLVDVLERADIFLWKWLTKQIRKIGKVVGRCLSETYPKRTENRSN